MSATFNKTGAWSGMACETELDIRALRSWFPLAPADWKPVIAEYWENFDTGLDTKLRVLFELPSGTLRLAERRNNKTGVVFDTRPAPPTLLKRWREDGRLPSSAKRTVQHAPG